MITIRLGLWWVPILIFFGVPFVARTVFDWIGMFKGAVTGYRAARAKDRAKAVLDQPFFK